MVVGPSQPDKQRFGDNAPPAEIDESVEIALGTRNVGNINLLQNLKLFGASKQSLRNRPVKISNCGTDAYILRTGRNRIG